MIDIYLKILNTFGVEYEIQFNNNYDALTDKIAVITIVGHKNQIRIIQCTDLFTSVTDTCLQYIDNTDYDGIPIDTDEPFETMVRNVIESVKI